MRLAQDGALVAVHHGRNRAAAEETVTSIERAGGRAFAIEQLLGDRHDAQDLFQKLDVAVEERTGSRHLDIVVNNAAVTAPGGLADVTAGGFDDLFALDVRARC